MGQNVEDNNLFMMCPKLNLSALRPLPVGYAFDYCRKDQLALWMGIHFDNPQDKERYRGFMEDFFQKVYAPAGDLFFHRCQFLCSPDGQPVGTCFIWNAYDRFPTVHWFKVVKEQEGQGLGRALLSHVMEQLSPMDYPVFLHTQPGSFRAIKLYSDFGFSLLTDPKIGQRENQLDQSLLYLREKMPSEVFASLKFSCAPPEFLAAAKESSINEF